MENWVVLSNCQTQGLANCVRMLAPNVQTQAVDVWLFRDDPKKWSEAAKAASRVLMHPLFLSEPGFDASACQIVNIIPPVAFAAYHPDLCYATGKEGLVEGPIAAYQSILMLAGYQAGLSVEQTLALFNDDMFRACGYYDLWPTEAARLIGDFKAQNLDISDDLRLWPHGGCFMHTFDHPKIRCMESVARALLVSLGVEPLDAVELPHDNQRSGRSWAVYPEVGDLYGVRGAYSFKALGDYRQISLRELIEASFRVFAGFTDIKVMGIGTVARFATAQTLLARP